MSDIETPVPTPESTPEPLRLPYTERWYLRDFVPADRLAEWFASHPTILAEIKADPNAKIEITFEASAKLWTHAGYKVTKEATVERTNSLSIDRIDLGDMIRELVNLDTIPTSIDTPTTESFLRDQLDLAVEKWMCLSDKEWLTYDDTVRDVPENLLAHRPLKALYDAKCQAAKVRQAARKAEREAEMETEYQRKEAAKAERAAKAEATEKAKRAHVTATLARSGTTEQVGRWNEEFMDLAEGLKYVRNELFATLDSFPRYQRMTPEDVCSDPDHEEVSFKTDDEGALNDAQYKRLQAIKAAATPLFPAESLTFGVKWHGGSCDYDRCEAALERIAVLVTVTRDGVDYSREYSLDD